MKYGSGAEEQFEKHILKKISTQKVLKVVGTNEGRTEKEDAKHRTAGSPRGV